MIFRRFQQIAFFVVLVEVFRTLYGTGIFQPIEDYLVDVRERMTERIILVLIKMGGGISLIAVVVRLLFMIDAIYYLIFFTILLITYNSWGVWDKFQENEIVVIEADQVIDLIIEEEYVSVTGDDNNADEKVDEGWVIS